MNDLNYKVKCLSCGHEIYGYYWPELIDWVTRMGWIVVQLEDGKRSFCKDCSKASQNEQKKSVTA